MNTKLHRLEKPLRCILNNAIVPTNSCNNVNFRNYTTFNVIRKYGLILSKNKRASIKNKHFIIFVIHNLILDTRAFK